jgi:acyl carrier protein
VEIGRRDILGGTQLDLGLFASGCGFSSYYPDPKSEAFEWAWHSVVDLLRRGEITPLPVRTFGVEDVDEAFAFMSHAHHIGKVVLSRPGAQEVASTVTSFRESALPAGITADRGVRAFRDALATGLPQVLVTRRVMASVKNQFIVAGHVLQGDGAASTHGRPNLAYELVPLQGETEERLGALLCGLLRIDRVGRLDRFLDLGGDSLYATQLVAQIRKTFGVRIAPADVLGGLALHELAELINRRVAAAEESS